MAAKTRATAGTDRRGHLRPGDLRRRIVLLQRHAGADTAMIAAAPITAPDTGVVATGALPPGAAAVAAILAQLHAMIRVTLGMTDIAGPARATDMAVLSVRSPELLTGVWVQKQGLTGLGPCLRPARPQHVWLRAEPAAVLAAGARPDRQLPQVLWGG